MSSNDIYKQAHNNVLACTRIGMTYKQIADEAEVWASVIARCFHYDTWAQHVASSGYVGSEAIERIANLNLSEMEKKYAYRNDARSSE